ncbi:late embryogenesis abundant protein [Striga asiatica]|uniref:Late embryogenesis abundant protein n=1 Tax=Striga asiatica TaxID=4170 RepID=A0A5A7PN92_STRAF|nr:late embryogenesis abundant protein [Striga asiatica]
MASSSSPAANDGGNRSNRDALPPPAAAVYARDLYRDPAIRRSFLRRGAPFLCRAAIWGLSVSLVFASLSALMWMVLRPSFPQIRVVSAAISAVSFTGGASSASAGCNVTFLLTNPNRNLQTVYKTMEIVLFYPSQQVLLSENSRPPFVQRQLSQITIETELSFKRGDLGIETVESIKRDLDSGSLSLEIKVLAVVRYKNGRWKTKSQHMRTYCGGVSFGFISSKRPGIFLNPYQECEVYF